MKTIRIGIAGVVAVWLLCIIPFQLHGAQEVELIDEFGNRAGTPDVKKLFREEPFPDALVLTNPGGLLRQMEAVSDYFQKYKKEDPAAVNVGIFSQLGITFSDVEATLRFARAVMAEDMEKGKDFRLQDPRFLREHFRVFRWYPYGGVGGSDVLRFTKYAVFTVKGQYKKSPVYNCALYGLPWDEKGMSLAEAEKQKQRLSRFRYTKQQVLGGVYDGGGALPLVWVSRGGLEEALLEGTICVEQPDGREQYFTADRLGG
ncbi:MAG: hypothetical protein GY950_31910, partial [bacterium]|nr:hypothetical protein [bacterium]